MHRRFALLCRWGSVGLTGCAGTGLGWGSRAVSPPTMIGADETGRLAQQMQVAPGAEGLTMMPEIPVTEAVTEAEVESQRPQWGDPSSRNPSGLNAVVASYRSRLPSPSQQVPVKTVSGQMLESGLMESLVSSSPDLEPGWEPGSEYGVATMPQVMTDASMTRAS